MFQAEYAWFSLLQQWQINMSFFAYSNCLYCVLAITDAVHISMYWYIESSRLSSKTSSKCSDSAWWNDLAPTRFIPAAIAFKTNYYTLLLLLLILRTGKPEFCGLPRELNPEPLSQHCIAWVHTHRCIELELELTELARQNCHRALFKSVVVNVSVSLFESVVVIVSGSLFGKRNDKSRTQEEMALQVAQMIISEITNTKPRLSED